MYKLVSDSSCDFTLEEVKKYDIDLVPFYISVDDEHYKKEELEWPVREIYDFLISHDKVFPKTSTPTSEDYRVTFEKSLQEGLDIICVCINAKFSSSIQSATIAKNELLEDYPERRIEIIDATFNTVLHGLLVRELCRLRDEGKSMDELLAAAKDIIPTGRIFFTVGNLDYLIHGGRIGKVTGMAANGLHLKPMVVLKDGILSVPSIARGRKQSMKKAIKMTISFFKDNLLDPDDYVFCVGYGYDVSESETLKNSFVAKMKEEFNKSVDVIISQIGATIAVYTGPYAVGIALLKRG